MKRVLHFLKEETVLVIAFLLAVASMFFVAPSAAYLDYVDYRTISLLFCLMCVVAGLNGLGIFRRLAGMLLKRVKSIRALCLTGVLLCYFSSMIITNDVALITFVPLTLITLKMSGGEKFLIPVVTLETIAANLGSMVTPIGNPQNVFLFSAFEMQLGPFLIAILPYAALSLAVLVGACFLLPKASVFLQPKAHETVSVLEKMGKKRFGIQTSVYLVLLILALLAVFRVFPYWIALIATVALVLVSDRHTLLRVDYSLLFTFVFLFVFIGNLGNIEAIGAFLHDTVGGDEVIAGVLCSQVFSNVPAAVLLSGFTQDAYALLIGVNLGGLGTLIASMASLISFRFLVREKTSAGKYLLVFTAYNVVLLAVNLGLWLLIGAL